MSERVAGASAAQTVSAHPPLSVAITTIAVMAVGMIGSTISSQLVDLDIADVAEGGLRPRRDHNRATGNRASFAEMLPFTA